MIEITIIYENHPNKETIELENAHGFSAYIEFEGKKILFDTGWDGNILLRNCKRLNISLKDLDIIFISHSHWDHMGGLPQVLEIADNPAIYIPDHFSTTLPKEFGRYLSDSYVMRVKNFTELNKISPNFASTGCFKKENQIGEHSFLIKYGKNNETLLLVGCLHPGLKVLLEAGKNFGKIDTLIGGLHGFKNIELLGKSNIESIFYGHCTQHTNLLDNLDDIVSESLVVGQKIKIN